MRKIIATRGSNVIWIVALALVGLMIHLSSGQSPRLKRKSISVGQQWEFKVVEFAPGGAGNTQTLNKLGAEGWDYAGLLHPGNETNANSSVVFRRLRDQYPAEFRR